MIELKATNGESFIINCELIERIETIPETKITLLNGKYLLVNNSKEEIIQKVIDYHRKIYSITKNADY